MGDRENLSIPVNLAFLAGLLVVSHLTRRSACPDRRCQTPGSAFGRHGSAGAEATPWTNRVPRQHDIGGRHDAETADRRDAGGDSAKAVSGLARPTADTPGPARYHACSRFQSGAFGHAAPKPIKPMSPVDRPEAAPALVPSDRARHHATGKYRFRHPQIPPLEPMTAEWQQTPDVMPQRRLTRLPAPGPQGDDGPVSTTAPPATPARPAEDMRPRASDFQAANLLMDDAARRLSLEFLWPSDRRSHARIYSRLTECLGVEAGVIDGTGNLLLGAAGGRGFNGALHSPFMRLVDQPVDPRELRTIESIRDGRRLTHDGRPVRVFRRDHDVRLLAALNRAFGGLPTDGRVTAEYRMEAGSLYLGKLTLDGRRHAGRVRLDHDGCI